jgi:hypothetical protein
MAIFGAIKHLCALLVCPIATAMLGAMPAKT